MGFALNQLLYSFILNVFLNVRLVISISPPNCEHELPVYAVSHAKHRLHPPPSSYFCCIHCILCVLTTTRFKCTLLFANGIRIQWIGISVFIFLNKKSYAHKHALVLITESDTEIFPAS